MNGFTLQTKDKRLIRFRYYKEAPITALAFSKALPFTQPFYHARVSGQEIWIDNAPKLDIIQENASVFVEPGEVVLGPLKANRAKTAGCFGIYYGEGKGLDCGNIFAKVFEEDAHLLKLLGDEIWKKGAQEITINTLE